MYLQFKKLTNRAVRKIKGGQPFISRQNVVSKIRHFGIRQIAKRRFNVEGLRLCSSFCTAASSGRFPSTPSCPASSPASGPLSSASASGYRYAPASPVWTGINVMFTIFGDFRPFSVKKIRVFFLEANVMLIFCAQITGTRALCRPPECRPPECRPPECRPPECCPPQCRLYNISPNVARPNVAYGRMSFFCPWLG
jgi:hypothetical protein